MTALRCISFQHLFGYNYAMPPFDLIAFDADDTLWQNERLFINAQQRFIQLLSQYHPPEWISQRLDATEARNIEHFGYGIKAFALSMIETAVELTEGRVAGEDIGVLVDLARQMLRAPVELLEGVAEVIPQLAARHRLMLITKGDLLDQESKINRSGLAQYFPYVEIVSQKTPATYTRILERYGIAPARFLMIGNALRSDILPVLELGGNAVYIPQDTTWAHEAATPPPDGYPGYYALNHLTELLPLLEKLG
jgi:putative hydrolase of the HAD superfamily